MLQFSINLDSHQGSLEAVSAHLWVLVQRRRRKSRSKGKKIMLVISSVDDSDTKTVLTALRTRVRKTRWQRISLPRTLVQSFLDSERTLHLKIACQDCGNLVRPILVAQKETKRLRSKSQIHSKGTKKRRRNKRHRSRRFKNKSSGPFLVIYTRYKGEQK